MSWYKIHKHSGFGDSTEEEQKINDDLQSLTDEYQSMYEGLDLHVYLSSGGYIFVRSVRVPEELRGQGIGTEIMNRIKDFAQKYNRHVVLSPEPERGKKKALDRFYRNLDFVHNKGRGKRYDLSSPFGTTMYWSPE